METAGKPLLIVIGGPTGSGKTDLAVRLAKFLGCSIVSADSRQVFQELKIGSAAPDDQQLRDVPHFFVGSHSISEPFNAGIFEKAALELLEGLFAERAVQIVCGGSGLYIEALLNGFDELPELNLETRAELIEIHTSQGIEALQQELQLKDPQYYNQVDLKNPQRLIRALEIIRANPGNTYSERRIGKKAGRPFDALFFATDVARTQLYSQINARTHTMLREGWLEEARALLPFRSLNALQTVGYTELFDCFDGKTTLERATELIQQNTRRYAKRQVTWLKAKADIEWISPTLLTQEIMRLIDGKRK